MDQPSPSLDDERFMRRAIALGARAGLELKSGGCFGAVVVKEGEIIGEGWNQVMVQHDPTWHGEMQAIREAGKHLGSAHLTGCTLYTSAEPCPMCLTAAYWAHLDRIYYAAHCEDAERYGQFDDVNYYQELAKPVAERKIPMQQLLREAAIEVWQQFAAMPDRPHY
jgi:tRNA(Arg) A34 adenosine deaminase TadA